MAQKLLQALQELYPFTPCQAPAFDRFDLNGMEFAVQGWDAAGLGRVSRMEATGMGGAMTMTALIVNPVELDAPLFNLDLITVPGKTMLYMELYDTLLTAVTKCAMPDQQKRLDQLVAQFEEEYLTLLQDARLCDPAQKKVRADAYRDGLLSHGGPATDGFLKAWGKEKTGELFEQVLFG